MPDLSHDQRRLAQSAKLARTPVRIARQRRFGGSSELQPVAPAPRFERVE